MSNPSQLSFYGAAGTVTGSKFLVDHDGQQILLDCGQFQGMKELRLRNWESPPFVPGNLAAIVLTHAHIDHCGLLPLVVRRGFRKPIYCTKATASLLPIMLRDAARLQEEDAEYANKKGYSKHHPAQPLFDIKDVEKTLPLVRPFDYHTPVDVTSSMTATFRRTGHILGSASVDLLLKGPRNIRLVDSGDLGRWNRPLLLDPEMVDEADVLLVESTYGNRLHSLDDTIKSFAQIINDAVTRGGAIIIPSFAVGRAQELIWRIRELENLNLIPKLPVFIDSPMAMDVSKVFCDHPEEHDIDMQLLMDENRCPLCCKPDKLLRIAAESKALNSRKGTFIVIAGSGMATGGRVVHHLKNRLPNKNTTVLLVGFQAVGTRGRAMQDGAKTIRIHGQDIPVRAHVDVLDGLSAHADQGEIMRWLGGFKKPPRQVYVVHGEPVAAQTLAELITSKLGWPAEVARDGVSVPL
jgi:metallo-beta-lactamase family protein